MNQVEVCILRKNIQYLNINANTIVLSLLTLLGFNTQKNRSNLLQFAV